MEFRTEVYQRSKDWLVTLACGAVVALVVFHLSPNGQPAYSPDSIAYMTAAQQWSAGKGLTLPSLSIIHPRDIPLTTWPPLYPVLLGTGIPPLLLQALLMGLIGVAVCLLFLRTLRLSPLTAPVAAVVTVLTWPLLVDASYVWSEVFGFFWVVGALLVLGILVRQPDRLWTAAWLSATAVALAVYTRYASLVFVPALVLALVSAPAATGRRWKVGLSSIAMVGGFVSPLLLRNLELTGHLSGAVRQASKLSFFQLMPNAVEHVAAAISIGPWMHALIAVAFAGAVIVAISLWLRRRASEGLGEGVWFISSVTLFALCDLVGIVILRSWRQFDSIDTRLISTVAPLLLIAATAVAAFAWQDRSSRTIRRVVTVAPVIGLLLLSAMTGKAMTGLAWGSWRNTGSPQWPAQLSPPAFYVNYSRLQVNGASFGTLLSSHARLWRFRTGLDVRAVPPKPWRTSVLSLAAKRANAILIDGPAAAAFARALQGSGTKMRRGALGRFTVFYWREESTGATQ